MLTGFKRRLPVRVRHYWKLLALCAAVVVGLIALAGNVQVTPMVTSVGEVGDDQVTQDISGTVDLFDHSRTHSISVTFVETEYQRMLDNYIATGDKDYIRADITIDGTYLPEVGLRLKGNSTLSSLVHKGQSRSRFERPGGPVGGGPGQQFPPGGQLPGGPPPGGQLPGLPPGGGGFGGPAGGGRATLDSTRPEELPWLISFDEYAKGRRYQGRSELAVRVSGMGGGSTVMNEALSLELLAQAGQTTQRYTYASVHVNSRPVKVRLFVEHPDTAFAADLGNGVLYKSLASGQFSYQGEDLTQYEDDFDQVNAKGTYDIKPVIDLIKWVNGSSDADFAAHLADYVDVNALAYYAAAQALLSNWDDMAGPGHNYYLWYDLDAKRFTVLSWDHNLTFSSMGGPRGMGGGGVGRGGHRLKERFLAMFKADYDRAHSDLSQRFYGNGRAVTALDAIAASITAQEGADAATIQDEANRLRTLLQQQSS